MIKEFSFKYGLLLYLREELAFLKNRSFEYYSKVDDLVSVFLFFSESLNFKNDFLKNQISNSAENIKNTIYTFIQNKTYLYKYKYFALNLCADLLEIIDKLVINSCNGEINSKSVEEMKNYLKAICLDVENLTKI
jgi:hypothetical protein